MPLKRIQFWLPSDAPHFQAILEQARDVARKASGHSPDYTAGMDQAVAELGNQLARTGVDVRADGVGDGFILGALFALAAVSVNGNENPGWVTGGVMAYAIRVVEGPIPPRAT